MEKDLIGQLARGFKFTARKYGELSFNRDMESYIGKIGTIIEIDTDGSGHHRIAKIEFEDDYWWYPLAEIREHLVSPKNIEVQYEIY